MLLILYLQISKLSSSSFDSKIDFSVYYMLHVASILGLTLFVISLVVAVRKLKHDYGKYKSIPMLSKMTPRKYEILRKVEEEEEIEVNADLINRIMNDD